jgi:HEAT repeat protein
MYTEKKAKLILRLSALVIMAMIFAGPSTGPRLYAQKLQKLNQFLQASDRSDPAIRLFEEGRDSIQDEDWKAAGQKFNQFIKEYPHHDKDDAALYWLAFSLERQQQFEEARRTLDQLLREYPKSSWINDAKTIRAEMAAHEGNLHFDLKVDGATVVIGESGADSENDEIKMVALRSLFQSNPAKASAFVMELSKPESKAPLNLKRAALNMLAQSGGKEGMAVLEGIVTSDREPELRRTAAFWLGQSGDDHALDLLKQVALQDKDPEIAKSAVFGISQRRNPKAKQLLSELATSAPSIEVKKAAIFGLVQTEGEGAVDELIKIYDSDHDVEIRRQVTFVLSQCGGPRAAAKLLEIAKSGNDVEVRKQAIFWLGQHEQTTETLISLYDSEANGDIKSQIMFTLSQSPSKAGLRKLIDIARNDKSVELRKRAIFFLGQSKDPEAEKFLEDILK